MGSKDGHPTAQAPLEIQLLDFLYGEWGDNTFPIKALFSIWLYGIITGFWYGSVGRVVKDEGSCSYGP